jgi:5-oxoprolinase (ATP-hydrolysing) subunit B
VSLRIVPLGDAAVLLELDDAPSAVAGARRAQALARSVERLDLAGVGAPVPGAWSVLVPFDPLAVDAAVLGRLLDGLAPEAPEAEDANRREHRLVVRYGGSDGPDLEGVAAALGITPAAVVELHSARTYEVLFLGFAPGFAYLGEVDPALVVPRLATPRVHVPAGSVAIAGTMSAVYPADSAGGWRILGRTDVCLFDPSAEPPAMLQPGDRVRFEPA